jgi:DNA-binding GntR family transcriptional regulator
MRTQAAPSWDDVGPIARTNLHGGVVTRVRDMIIEGVLKPGTRVPERELCERLAVSRTPMREALKVLASEGLVTLLPNRGAVITKLSPKDVRDTLAVMGKLAAMAGELACARASDGQIAEVLGMHGEMLKYYAEGRLLDYFKVNQAIHTRIIAMADNTALSLVHPILSARMRRMRYLGNERAGRWAEALAEHEQFMQSLLRRDGNALGAQLRQHLEATWTVIAPMLEEAQVGQ